MNKKVILIVALAVFAVALLVFLSSENEMDVPTPDPVTEPGSADEVSTNDSAASADDPLPPLTGTSWVWSETTYQDDSVVTPNQPGSFVLSFIDEGQFGAQTDCNNVRGSYTLEGNSVVFEQMAMTQMACMNDIQEGEFVAMLELAEGINVDAEDRLVLALPTGTMVFTAL